MTFPIALSYLVAAVAIVAAVVQIRRLRTKPTLRRVVQIVGLLYFSVLYIVAAAPDADYLIRSGIMSRLGLMFLLFTLAMDKGDC